MHTTTDKPRLVPTRVAPETFLIHDHHGEGEDWVGLNTMLIRGAEPVVVDTGMHENQDRYLEDVFSLVDPDDVRWVFISHDDVDHTGNVNVLMERCPNATLVIDWFMQERMGASLEVPMHRWRWVQDGDALDVGDRTLRMIRPPVFDSGTTRGLFDPTTGVYWASDAFAAPMHAPVTDVAELEPQQWQAGIQTLARYISPWLELVDDFRFGRSVDRVAELSPTVLAGCHTPAVSGDRVELAFTATRLAPRAGVPAQPDQAVLDVLLGALEPSA
jgi:flavorubredoxin